MGGPLLSPCFVSSVEWRVPRRMKALRQLKETGAISVLQSSAGICSVGILARGLKANRRVDGGETTCPSIIPTL